MPVTISELLSDKKQISAPLGGGRALSMTIRPGKMSRAEREKHFSEKGGRGLEHYLCAVIVGWDLELEPGKPAPVSPETFDLLPDFAVESIVRALAKEGSEPAGELTGCGTSC